jgi:hypothetical protein
VEQVVAAEACTTRAGGANPATSLVRGGQRGVRLPEHSAAQHRAQVTGHGTRLTTGCRSAVTRAGKGNSTPGKAARAAPNRTRRRTPPARAAPRLNRPRRYH